MPFSVQDATVLIDGQLVDAGMHPVADLARAVIISLFTWRRAGADDKTDDGNRCGWWGDSTATVNGDRIGSRLWLLARAKLTAETIRLAKDYAQEALQWLVDDGAAKRVEVKAERSGFNRIDLLCTIFRSDGTQVDIRFADLWNGVTSGL